MTLRFILIAWNTQETGFWKIFVIVNHCLTYNGHSNFDGPLHMYTNCKNVSTSHNARSIGARPVESTTGISDERISDFSARDWSARVDA
jgi:hypothetical protein